MSDTAKLLIPMYVEALVLKNDQNKMTDIRPQIKKLSGSFLGKTIQPNGNQSVDLEKGVHLHWTLPKALKHAFVSETDQGMEFPLVPNRWLVVRLCTSGKQSSVTSRAWIIDSSSQKIDDKRDPNLLTVVDAGNHPDEKKIITKIIGTATDLDKFIENHEPNTLTAVPPANPFFASFYPGCRNIFGFHDPVTDIPDNSKLTYVVTGWYNNLADDPISPITAETLTPAQKSKKQLQDWISKYWHCEDGETADSCLLHGSVTAINWDQDIANNGIPDGQVNVFAGQTAIEAQSANINHNNTEKKPGAEDLLNALQYQLLDDEHNIPDLPLIKEEVHKRAFSAVKAGEVWEIKRNEQTDQQMEKDADQKLQFPHNATLFGIFNALNRAQTRLNKLLREQLSIQQEYYFLWYKQAQIVVNAFKDMPFDYPALRVKIFAELEKGEQAQKEANTEITSLLKQLQSFPELDQITGDFKLTKRPEDTFWEANDPVLLLEGNGVGKVEKPNLVTGEQSLSCRLLKHLNAELHIEVPTTQAAKKVSISVDDICLLLPNTLKANTIPYQEISKIIAEALLLDEYFATGIALMAYKKADMGDERNREDSLVVSLAKEQVILAQKNCPLPAQFSINKWQQAWSPLFMNWEVTFSPTFSTLKDINLNDNAGWLLQDHLFYQPKNSEAKAVNKSISFISPLSAAVYENIKRLLPPNLVEAYGKKNLIAQSLSGLNKKLLTQQASIQFPPIIYNVEYSAKTGKIIDWDTEHIIDREELRVIGNDGYKQAPDAGSEKLGALSEFYPLRAGMLKIESLSIVDAFGQKKDVLWPGKSDAKVIGSTYLKGTVVNTNNLLPLAPRLLQPSRLIFNWLNKKDEIVYQDTHNLDSPVFGWLVPNYLDNSLMIFDEKGNEIVMLKIARNISASKGLKLQKLPFPGSAQIPELKENLHLKHFIDGINSGPIAASLLDLALKINLNVMGNVPLTDHIGSLLNGEPMALARCGIGLELHGKPIYDQSWGKTGTQETGGIETVKIPVYLGDQQKNRDGLIGYFEDGNPDFNVTANAPIFEYNKLESFFKLDQPVMLKPGQENVKLTLLLNASAGLHITTGILPVKFVQLFSGDVKSMLSNLKTGFLVAPFIAEAVEPSIPTPAGITTEWKWNHKTDVTTWAPESKLSDAKNKKLSDFSKQQLYEGWLTLKNQKK